MEYKITDMNLTIVKYLLTFDKNTLMVHIEFPNKKIEFSFVDIYRIYCDITFSEDCEQVVFGIRDKDENDILLIQFPNEYKISGLYVMDLYEKVKELYKFKQTNEYKQIRLEQYKNDKSNDIQNIIEKYENANEQIN
jgi:hypothetical protein